MTELLLTFTQRRSRSLPQIKKWLHDFQQWLFLFFAMRLERVEDVQVVQTAWAFDRTDIELFTILVRTAEQSGPDSTQFINLFKVQSDHIKMAFGQVRYLYDEKYRKI